jgi:hypothetical protein
METIVCVSSFYIGNIIFVNILSRVIARNLMLVCTTVLYEYMNLFRSDVYNLFVNTHVRIKIHRFFHGIIYIANERRQFNRV